MTFIPARNETAGMLMAVGQGVSSWVAMVPDVKHLQDMTPDDDASSFRRTEITAAGLTVGIGALGSLILKSIYPLLAAILVVVLLVLVYEWSYRSEPPSER